MNTHTRARPSHDAAFGGALALVLCVVGCGAPAASATPAHAVSPPLEEPASDFEEPAPESCLTIRDAELGCVDRCESIMPVLSECAQTPGVAHLHPSGRIDVHYAVDASGVAHTEVAIEGEDLAPIRDCVRAAFQRFRPCSPMRAGDSLDLPIRVDG
jgi:hypothetical protein